MGGECYSYVYLPTGTLPEGLQAAYKDVAPKLLEAFKEWKIKQKMEEWDFKEGSPILFSLKNIGANCNLFRGISLPLQLVEESDRALWTVGWQHRSYGSKLDPSYELGVTLSKILRQDTVLCKMLRWEEEDNIAADLGANDYLHDEEKEYDWNGRERSPADYTACDKECGYCGHCDY